MGGLTKKKKWGILIEVVWRCIEVVVTRLTRNQLTGNTVRGFESLHLRQKPVPLCGLAFLIDWDENPRRG